MRLLYGFLCAAAVAVILGCSSGPHRDPATPPMSGTQPPSPRQGHALWGLFDVLVDPASEEPVRMTPLRAGSFHCNIRTFLENTPCSNCLTVTGFHHLAGGFSVEITIQHPFPNDQRLAGFDVRGTCFFDGGSVFPKLAVRASSPLAGDAFLADPDGFTTLFNPTEFPGAGILSYTRGKLVPPGMPNPKATLGAFKAFYSEGQSEDEGGRRAFLPGDKIARTYEIVTPVGGPFRYGYAIDASWAAPSAIPPVSIDDFPASANCPEPFRIDIEEISNTLTNDFGSVILAILAYDHQGVDGLGECSVEAPGLTDEVVVDDTPEEVGPNIARYECRIDNELGAASLDGEEVLIRVAHDTPDPNLGLVPAWCFDTVGVRSAPPFPVVESIDPNFGYQGSTVEAIIHGAGFKLGASVELYQGINVLPGENIVVQDSFTLSADFHLAGPLGYYTVYVENPDAQWGQLVDAFEVLKPSSECSDSFHTDTLGTGQIGVLCASQYDCAFLMSGPFEGMMLATRQTLWGHSIVAVDVDTTTPSDPITFPDALGNVGWKTIWSADIDPFTGWIFIAWLETMNTLDIYSSSGEPIGAVQMGPQAEIRGLDHDGYGGFWVAFEDGVTSTRRVSHFVFDPVDSTYGVKENDSFDIVSDYGVTQDIAVIPDDRLFVLCTSLNGTVLSYDLTASPPFPAAAIDHLFPGPMPVPYTAKSGNIEIDQTDPEAARCRIVAYGKQPGGSSMVVKLDRDLGVLNEAEISDSYEAMAINPDLDIAVHHITLFPQTQTPSVYRLLETPPGW